MTNFSTRLKKTWQKKYLPYYIVATSFVGGTVLNQISDLSTMPAQVASVVNIPFQLTLHVPTLKYGFDLDHFKKVQTGKIASGEVLGDIFKEHGESNEVIARLNALSDDALNIANLRAGNNYTILSKNGEGIDYFIYEPSLDKYVILDVRNNLTAKVVQRPMESKIKLASGVVQGSLWKTLQDNGLSGEIIDRMEDALASTVDFHHVQPGDAFKLIYEQHTIEGKPSGVGKLLGCYFKSNGKENYAVYYSSPNEEGFFDLEGRPMKKSFLKAPLRFSHITSRFSMSRLHPVLKYHRPHFGTDFAAPHGTPIMAVSDGVVTEARYANGNGNYVKIKHNNTYSTQYLHMSRFGKGIRPGTRVIQGQTIGYVGATGWATGPHVCFRFWKNGKQVNFLNEKLPRPDPINADELKRFNLVKESMLAQLDGIPLNTSDKVIDTDTESIVNP